MSDRVITIEEELPALEARGMALAVKMENACSL